MDDQEEPAGKAAAHADERTEVRTALEDPLSYMLNVRMRRHASFECMLALQLSLVPNGEQAVRALGAELQNRIRFLMSDNPGSGGRPSLQAQALTAVTELIDRVEARRAQLVRSRATR
jgi:ABC-type branched-subunit amino acid transport system ATPase component